MSEERVNLAAEFSFSCPEHINQNETVLLIDNQQDMRLIMAHYLNKMGFKNVQQVVGGQEALQFLEGFRGQVSVIICALELPMMTGLDFLHEIKEDPRYSRGPFAITMMNPNREKIMFATENGVDEILVKPFSLKDILPKLNNAFKKFHNPYNPEKVYELAKKHYRDARYDEGEKIYKRLAESATNAARPIVGLARIAAKQGDHQKAMKLLAEAEKRNPNYVHLFVLRGELFAELNRLDEAIPQFRKAIEMSPLNPVRYESAAKILFQQNKYQEAVDLLSIAIKNELNFPSLHHYLSQAFYALKDYKRAIKHIRAALAIDAENVVYLNQLGIAYKESEMYEDATRVYNSIIKLDPENKAALYNKAVLLHTMGTVDEAIKILQRVVKKHPDFKQAAAKLSEYEKEKGAPKAAS